MSAWIVADLVESCGQHEERRWLCELAWRSTNSHGAARFGHTLTPWITSLLIIIGAVIVSRIAKALVRRFFAAHLVTMTRTGKERREERIGAVTAGLSSFTTVVVSVVAVIAILTAFGVELAPLVAGAGLVGVALGFGAQNMLRDLLSGGFMIAEDQFGVGDHIDTGVAVGTVLHMTLRVTRLVDDEGVVWHIPNGEIRRVGNHSQQP